MEGESDGITERSGDSGVSQTGRAASGGGEIVFAEAEQQSPV